MVQASTAQLQTVRLAELLGALSHALDMTEGQPPGHCIRCCWIGLQVGWEIGLAENELAELYYTLLLKDLGCSSNAARICELYIADDLAFKRDVKHLDDANFFETARFALDHTALGSGLWQRFKVLLGSLRTKESVAQELIVTRCQRGASIARRLRFHERVAQGIHSLDEHYNGQGRPERLSGQDIPLYSRIALLAQVVEVFHSQSGVGAALEEAKRRSGTWFDPELVSALLGLGANVNSADHAGNSVLMGAAFKGHLEVVDLLLAADADASHVNAAGLNAETFAAAFGRGAVVNLLRSRAVPSPSTST